MCSSQMITPNFPITLLPVLQGEQSNGEQQGHAASFERKTPPAQEATKENKSNGKD